jgi:hypothetical protein
MPGTTIGRGNVIYDYLAGPSLTPVSVAGATSAEQNFTVVGLQVGDFVDVFFNGVQTAGIGIANARVSALNTLTILFQNSTAGALTPAAGQYVMNVTRPENLPLPVNAA